MYGDCVNEFEKMVDRRQKLYQSMKGFRKVDLERVETVGSKHREGSHEASRTKAGVRGGEMDIFDDSSIHDSKFKDSERKRQMQNASMK